MWKTRLSYVALGGTALLGPQPHSIAAWRTHDSIEARRTKSRGLGSGVVKDRFGIIRKYHSLPMRLPLPENSTAQIIVHSGFLSYQTISNAINTTTPNSQIPQW
jgi:hypothetical protein